MAILTCCVRSIELLKCSLVESDDLKTWQAWPAPASEEAEGGLAWTVSAAGTTHPAVDICQIVSADGREEANAEFIVRAVNSHQDLVRAARCGAQWLLEMSTMIESDDPHTLNSEDARRMREDLACIETVLAKATGKWGCRRGGSCCPAGK
jgi:hypothetical protein